MRMLTLALGLLAQDKEAEALFRKFEKRCAESKALAIRFRLTITQETRTLLLTGSVSFKPGDKFAADFLFRDREVDRTEAINSDGRTLKVFESGRWREETLAKGTSRYLSATTPLLGMTPMIGLSRLRSSQIESLSDWQASGFAFAESDKPGVKAISFVLEFNGRKSNVTLWVNAESLTPVKRKTITRPGEQDESVLIEEYESFSTAEIPDSEFDFGK